MAWKTSSPHRPSRISVCRDYIQESASRWMEKERYFEDGVEIGFERYAQIVDLIPADLRSPIPDASIPGGLFRFNPEGILEWYEALAIRPPKAKEHYWPINTNPPKIAAWDHSIPALIVRPHAPPDGWRFTGEMHEGWCGEVGSHHVYRPAAGDVTTCHAWPGAETPILERVAPKRYRLIVADENSDQEPLSHDNRHEIFGRFLGHMPSGYRLESVEEIDGEG